MASNQSSPGAGTVATTQGTSNSSQIPVTVSPGATKIDTGNATPEQAAKMQTNANLMAKYGAGNYDITPAGDVVQKTSPVGIVTSNKSQTTYNDNVATLQKNLDALRQNVLDYATSKGEKVTGEKPVTETKETPTDGSTIMTDSGGNKYTIPAGMDTGIATSLINNLDTATSEIQSYKDQIATLGSYDVSTDPVAVAAAQRISDSYDVLIKQMENKNKILMGSIKTTSARSGMLQYGNEMDSMYKNAEFDAATQRIADLERRKTDAINKSNEAYKSGNVKDLEQATKDYEAAQKEGRQALLDLQSKIDDTIKSNQAQANIDAANVKTQNALDISTSNSVAQSILDDIIASGVTDEATIDDYINSKAEENGITNPAILKGKIAELNPQSGTAALKNQNIISQIAKRNKSGTDTGSKNEKLKTTINNALIANNAIGSDKKVSWETYRDMLLTWVNNDGVESEFYLNYPANIWLDEANKSEFSNNVKKLAGEEDTIVFKSTK